MRIMAKKDKREINKKTLRGAGENKKETETASYKIPSKPATSNN